MTKSALHARPAGDSPVCANKRVRLAPEKGLGDAKPPPKWCMSYTLHNQSFLRLASRSGSLRHSSSFVCQLDDLVAMYPFARTVRFTSFPWIQDSTHFSHSAAWKELGGGFRTLPVGFPLPTIFWSPLFILFCPLILDHDVCLIISISGLKNLHSQILLDTSSYHCLQSVIIKSSFLLMNLHIVQFQYGLEFLRLSYSEFVQTFQDAIKWDFRHW